MAGSYRGPQDVFRGPARGAGVPEDSGRRSDDCPTAPRVPRAPPPECPDAPPCDRWPLPFWSAPAQSPAEGRCTAAADVRLTSREHRGVICVRRAGPAVVRDCRARVCGVGERRVGLWRVGLDPSLPFPDPPQPTPNGAERLCSGATGCAASVVHGISCLRMAHGEQVPPPPPPLLEAPVRKMILQMHPPARSSQCWSRQTPAWTRSVHLDAPGQRHGQQPVSGTANPGIVKQDKSSGGSVDTTKTGSGPQRV